MTCVAETQVRLPQAKMVVKARCVATHYMPFGSVSQSLVCDLICEGNGSNLQVFTISRAMPIARRLVLLGNE